MKRSSTLIRRTPLRGGKPLPAVGKGAKARKARTRKARQSAHTKQWRLDVLARDGGRCTVLMHSNGTIEPRVFAVPCDAEKVAQLKGVRRCSLDDSMFPMHVHHRENTEIGAEELDDGVTTCREHHEQIEFDIRWYRKVRP